MLVKVVVGLIMIVCIVKWIIRGLSALGAAIAEGLTVVLPVIFWSLAALAGMAVAGIVLRAVVLFVPWSSFTMRLPPRLTSDLALSISTPSAAPSADADGRTSHEPSETVTAGIGPAEEQSAEPEVSEPIHGIATGARGGSAPGRCASPPPMVRNSFEPQDDTVNVGGDNSAEADHGLAIVEPAGDVWQSELVGSVHTTELPDIAWPANREPSLESAGQVENHDADVSSFMLFQRCGAAVLGHRNHLLIAWSIRIEKPQMDFGALFSKAEVKAWMRALREGSVDELQLRSAAAKAMCVGHGAILEPAVIDIDDQFAPATVQTLPELWDLLGDMVIFWRCDTAVKGNGNTVPVEVRHLYRHADVDSAQLFSENPVLARLLLDSVANGSVDSWTARLNDVLGQTLRNSSALDELPADRVLQFTKLEEPTRIADADYVSIGEGNTSRTTVELHVSKTLRSGSAAELNRAAADADKAQRAAAEAARDRRIEEITRSSLAPKPLSGARLDRAIEAAQEVERAAHEGRQPVWHADTETDLTSVDRSPNPDPPTRADIDFPSRDFGGF